MKRPWHVGLPVSTFLLLGFAGCVGSLGTAIKVYNAWKEQEAGHFDKCAELSGQVVQESQARVAQGGEAGDKIYSENLMYLGMGYSGHGQCLKALGQAEKAKPDFERCVETSSKAIEQYRIREQRGSNNPNERLAIATGLSDNYRDRASCRKELGHLAEAVADMEEQIKHNNEACHHDWIFGTKNLGETYCHQVADDTELLAQWKKELAAQGKQEKP